MENVQSNPANLTKADNKEYIFYRRHDETLSPIGTNVTHGCLKNVQYISRKFVNMYLTQNGLPIEQDVYVAGTNEKGFKGYATMTSEFENRDNRLKSQSHGEPRAETGAWRHSSPMKDFREMPGRGRRTANCRL